MEVLFFILQVVGLNSLNLAVRFSKALILISVVYPQKIVCADDAKSIKPEGKFWHYKNQPVIYLACTIDKAPSGKRHVFYNRYNIHQPSPLTTYYLHYIMFVVSGCPS